MDDKKRLFSAVQPSGKMTIGNYLGAISNFKLLQEDYDCIFSLADLHTLTVRQDPATLRKNTYDLLATYLACGLDPEKSIIFLQSHIHEHAELTWILNTICYPGELQRMTQFKDKSRKHADNVNMGLMDYPVLMAADILLYGTDIVPIGIDQKQHLELARDLATRFNGIYGDVFHIPDCYISKSGYKITSLQDPLHKMSKSDENENAYILLDDDDDAIIRKFKRAVTDSDNKIISSPDKPGISNLLTIYTIFTGESLAEAEKRFEGVGYGVFKQAVGEAVVQAISPLREEKNRLLADKAYLNKVLSDGAEKAGYLARKMLGKIYKKMGLVPLERH